MSIRMTKPWQPLNRAEVDRAPGHMGVYEIADADERILYIGRAGGGSQMGLRGELATALEHWGERGAWFRYEVTLAYISRAKELLMVEVFDRGVAPEGNADEPIGRLSPNS